MGKSEQVRWGGISSEAVEARTGKGWDGWLRILDDAGAARLPHKDIARHLHENHAVPAWWAQMITVGYEQARRLRQVHEKPGGFEASCSRTFALPVSDLYRHFLDARLRAKWLGRHKLTVRKATESKSMRITWGDGSNLDVYFWNKGERKSSVQIQHGKLAGATAVASSKAFWKERLARLSELLAGSR